MKVAIVDDSMADASILRKNLERYAEEKERQIYIQEFIDGLTFISDYQSGFDIIFLDIKMPNMNGLDVAKHLRAMDKDVCIMFLTSMAQFAIRGYEVNALDYIIKPLDYHNLADKMGRAEKYILSKKQSFVMVKVNDCMMKFQTSNIVYVEKDKNYLIYHTADGDYRTRGTMYELETQLFGYGFGKCTHGCLVNYRYVIALKKNTVQVDAYELPLSRRDRKDFVDGLIAFCGGRVANG